MAVRVRVRVRPRVGQRTGRPMGADVTPCTGTPRTTVGTAVPGGGGGGGGGAAAAAAGHAAEGRHAGTPMRRSSAWA